MPRRIALARALSIAVPLSAAGTARAAEPADPVPVLHAGDFVLDDILGVETGIVSGFAPQPVLMAQISGIFSFSETTQTSSGMPSTFIKESVFFFQPSFDVMVGPHLSLGGVVIVGNAHVRSGALDEPPSSESDIFTVGATPRIGYLVPLADDLGVWPRASVGMEYGQPGDGSVTHAFVWRASLDAPLVTKAGRHVVLMFGPELGFATESDRTSDAASIEVGSATVWYLGFQGSVGLAL